MFVKRAVETMINLDFRTPFAQGNPEVLLSLHPGDFLFVEYRQGARILHVLANGTAEWVDGRFTASGGGAPFAHALLITKYARRAITCERAKLLAYKFIDEAIEVGAYGLGHPIDLWELTAAGVKQVSSEERQALDDVASALREKEVELLVGPAPPPRPEGTATLAAAPGGQPAAPPRAAPMAG